MAELIFALRGYDTHYMGRRLDAKQAESFGCPGANMMLLSTKRENSYMIGNLAVIGKKAVKIREGRFRGTWGTLAHFAFGNGEGGTTTLLGYFCEV